MNPLLKLAIWLDNRYFVSKKPVLNEVFYFLYCCGLTMEDEDVWGMRFDKLLLIRRLSCREKEYGR